MNDKIIETIQRLERAESNEEILLALEPLKGQKQSKESFAVINAAGSMLADNLNNE